MGKSAVPSQATAFDAHQRALLDKISNYLSGVQTLVGNFVQIGPDGRRVEGTFYIQKPGKVRFAYNPPSPIDIIADGSAVVVRDRSLETSDYYPLSQTPLRYLLADHIDLLRDTDVVSVSADDTFITVVIEETRLLTGTSRLMIMFDAKNLQLKQWTVTDPQGLDTTVAVYNLDTTKKPDPNLFVINYQNQNGRAGTGMVGTGPAISEAGSTRGNSDQPRAALERHVDPQPVQRHREAVAQSDQKIDVDGAPEQPTQKPGELQRAKLHHRRLAADRGEFAHMMIDERRRRRPALHAGGDDLADIAAHLLGRRRDAGNRAAVAVG